MAAVSITAANVLPSSKAKFFNGVAGETITAGQAVYFDGEKVYLAQCDSSVQEAAAIGIAAHGASVNQNIRVVTEDPEFTVGGTVAVGAYCLGTGTGGIVPSADIVTTNKYTLLGVAYSTTKMILKPVVSGAAVA